MILATLKSKALWLLGAVLTVLAAIFRHKQVIRQRDIAKAKAEIYEAAVKRQQVDKAMEEESANQWSDYKREAEKDLDRVPDIISKPRDRR